MKYFPNIHRMCPIKDRIDNDSSLLFPGIFPDNRLQGVPSQFFWENVFSETTKQNGSEYSSDGVHHAYAWGHAYWTMLRIQLK